MQRRDVLKSLAVSSLLTTNAGLLPRTNPAAIAGEIEEGAVAPVARVIPWQNWSGGQKCMPAARVAPQNLDELAMVLAEARGPVRAVGSGHSFTALVPTNDTIVSLRNFSGMLSHDAGRIQATFAAGTKLGSIGEPLSGVGQALPNMPDINKQSLAGAFATATHGTGKTLGAMHSNAVQLKLMTASGELLTCSASQNADIFKAAKVSLGSLGIVTEYTLQNQAAYNLKRRSWVEPFDELLERMEQLGEENLTFEFFYIPFSDMAIATTTNVTDEPITGRPPDDDNEAVLELKSLRDKLGWITALRAWLIKQAVKGQGEEEFVDEWWKIFPYERAVRFNEMEYHLPADAGASALRDIRDVIEKDHKEVFFPIEFRYTRQDDAWLSPFYKRASCSIAVHRYYEEDYKPFFKDVEPVHRKYDGRPHWGKIHTLGSDDFAGMYPQWQDFLEVRAALDPEGKFLNDHLRHVFGV